MKNEDRNCEICGNKDLDTIVTASTLGACNFNYCTCCLGMGAEPAGMEDLFGDYYTFKNDSYWYKGQVQEIKLKSFNKSFLKRSDYVDYIKDVYSKIQKG